MPKVSFNIINILILFGVVVALLVVGFYNYLFFHSIIELMSIVVAGLIFMVTYSAKKIIDNTFILVLGVAYLFIGTFDMLHTLSYSGLNVFPGADPNLPTQLWLAARFTESLSILTALFLLRSKFKFQNIFYVYLVLTVLVLLSIFYWHIFPVAYVDGQGLTAFKISSEYFIVAVLVVSLYLLYLRRREFNQRVFMYLNYSIGFTIVAELVFTLYLSVYSDWNILGHLLKLISYYYAYKAVAEIGIQEPQELFFNNLKKSEERLVKSEKKYKDLFDNMTTGFALHKMIINEAGVPVDYEFVEVNEAFRQITGLGGQVLIGRRVTAVIPGIEKDPADWIGRYGRVVKQGETLKFEQYAEPLGRWFLVSAYCPQVGYFAAVVEDISERKKVEKERESYTERLEGLTNELFKFQLAVEDASEAIIITDPTGKIVFANKATEAITGYTNKEIIGRTSSLWGNLMPPESRDCDCEGCYIWDCLPSRDNRFNGEIINRRKNGEEFYSYLTISPVLNERREAVFFVCIERDITKLKEVDKLKSEFVYFVSHELKTPLASIVLSIDLLRRGVAGDVLAEQLEYLDTIRDAGRDMSEFIESLMNISRIESNTLFLDNAPLDAGMAIKNLTEGLKREIDNKELLVELDIERPLPILVIDEKVFNLIFRNLLTNAIHYTPTGGRINVLIRQRADRLEVSVADTGCGIPLPEQDKVYNKLYRSTNTPSSQASGSGLGLYIVKNMVDKIGARIELQSAVGQGTTFRVSLPLPSRAVLESP